jgi:hypothetical protein
MLPTYQAPPEIISDYYLGDLFSVVYPEGTTNICTNPSFETNTTGWTAVGGSIVRATDWQTRGVYSLAVTPTAALNDGVYFGPFTTTTAQPYTFSLDFQGQANHAYQIYFATTGAVILGTAFKFRATGRKQRIKVSWFETGGASRRVYVTKDNQADIVGWFMDAVQIENKAYDTTYADGDQRGVIAGQTDFYWTGTPHASTSVRNANCRIGGRVMKLSELGFNLLAVLGLGMSGLNLQMTPIATGGAHYQGTVVNDRSFTLIGEVSGGTLAQVQRQRQALIDLFRPDLVSPDSPIALRYTPTNDCGEVVGDELEILCIPESGMQGQTDNRHAERLALSFRLYLPFVGQSVGEAGAVLDYQDSIANAGGIIKRSPAGLWSALQTGLGAAVHAVTELNDGTLAVGGDFLNAGGVANADYLAKYDPATDTFSAFNATPLSAFVRTIVKKPDGNLLIGGNFTNAGDANGDYIALVTVATGAFSSINATPLNAGVNVIVLLPNGDYAAGGAFTNAGGAGDADYICRINGTTFAYSAFNATPLATFAGGQPAFVYDIQVMQDGNAILSGSFLNAGGVAEADLFCRLNLTSGAFEALTDTSLAITDFGYAIAQNADGIVYLGGTYLNGAGDVNADHAVEYNGVVYSPLATGMDNSVYEIKALPDGTVIFGGLFTRAGPLSLFDRMAIWTGSSFVMVDVDLSGTPIVYELALGKDGTLYVGHDNGAATALVSGVTTITNDGTAKAYPRIKFTGPGIPAQLKNWTTGKSLWFNLTLLAGEMAVLDFSDQLNVTFESNVRGNLLGTILPGSSLDFFLQPNQNSISLFIGGSTDGNTAASLSWRENHHSLDGAIPMRLLP